MGGEGELSKVSRKSVRIPILKFFRNGFKVEASFNHDIAYYNT
jgi:hypothetical protein